jgi:iron complex outermembrane recepter protein
VSSGLLASSLFIIAPQSLGQELPIVAPHRICAVRFAINAKAADEALIEFAKQAELTIVFPFNKVKESVSNALYGQYCPSQAIELLLLDTGLTAQFSNSGALVIKSLDESEAEQHKSLITKVVELFTDEGEDLMTYPKSEDTDYELILVKGMRASAQRSLDIKQGSHEIVDAIRAEDIGKFPDLNLAESLQRITGVSIDRAEGEGQFVTVRGFGPQFNTVLTNGRRLATDNQGREFSFDTLASELVSGVSVNKTFSAGIQSGGIGSTINIETARPFSQRGFKVAGSVKAMFDSNSEQLTPQGTMLISHSNEQFGWLLSFSEQKHKARINEAQTDGWLLNTNIPPEELTTTSENIFVPRNYDQRVRFDERTRTGGTLVLQYRPSPDLDISLDYLSSRFNVETQSTSMGHWFTSSNLEDVVTDDNGTVIEFSQRLGHATDFHSRTFDRPSKLNALGLNIEWQTTANLMLNLDISLSDASIEDTKGAANALSLVGYLNRSHFDHRSNNILPSISGFEQADPTIVNAEGEIAGVSDYLDPANGKAHVMLRRGWNLRDDLDQLRSDGVWDIEWKNLTSVSFGLMLSQQIKNIERWDNEYNFVHCSFCGYFAQPDLPDNFQHVFDAGDDFLEGISGSQNVPHIWLRHYGEEVFDFLESISDVNFDAVKRDSSFTLNEQVKAVYVDFTFSGQLLQRDVTLKTGLRIEDTQTKVEGIEADLVALTILDQTELGQVFSAPRPIKQHNQYQHWLPSWTARWELSDEISARWAMSRSVTRPTISQMSPSLTFNTTRQGGDLRVSSGNPALQAFESSNLDFAIEWYFAPSSYMSLGFFRKKVDNFIVSQSSSIVIGEVKDPSTGSDPSQQDPNDDIAIFALSQPVNSETATVKGWELAVQYDFKSGFGLLANATIVDSNAKLDSDNISQKFALTGLSNSQNVIVYYESDPFQIRLAWNQRDGFLQSLTQIQGGEPTIVSPYQQLDMGASYALNEQISVFVEGVNLTQESVIKHGRYENQLLLVQQPGARFTLGVRGSF